MVNKKVEKCSRKPTNNNNTNHYYLVEPNSSKRFNVVMKQSCDLSDLRLAYKYVTPVLDEIISQATSYTESEFQKILESNSAICSISRVQYAKALKASEIVNEIATNVWPCPLQETMQVNTVSIPFGELSQQIDKVADRISIDRDLMKKLVDLHELITETIKKLREEATASKVPELGQKEEEVYAMKASQHQLEETPHPQMSETATHNFSRSASRITQLTMPDNVDEEKEDMTIQKKPSTVEAPAAVPSVMLETPVRDQILNSNISMFKTTKIPVPIKKSHLRTLTVEPALRIPDSESELSEVLEVVPSGDEEINFNPPITSSKIDDIGITLPEETTAMETKQTNDPSTETTADMSEFMKQKRDTFEDEYEDLGKEAVRYKLMQPVMAPGPVETTPTNSADVERFKKLFQQLSVALDYIRERTYKSISETNIAQNGDVVVFGSKSDTSMSKAPSMSKKSLADNKEYTFEDALRTQREILGCLKELAEMKEILKKIDNPELEVDTTPGNTRPCCNVNMYPHIHARLNGVAVIVKMNQDTIDILLAESFAVEKSKGQCSCTSRGVRSSAHSAVTEQPFYETRLQDTDQVVLRSSNSRYRCRWKDSSNDLTVTDLLEYDGSVVSLPYTCNRKSLPHVNVCSAMRIKVDKLKSNMTTHAINYPKLRIKQKLIAVGVDNLIEISKPARCCRRAVINEVCCDEDPYHASLNSLPLTNSDLRTIKKLIVRTPKCMMMLRQQPEAGSSRIYNNTIFEYYTNFQENFASNIDYFVPRSLEVRFFHIFTSTVAVPPKLWNLLFRRGSSAHRTEEDDVDDDDGGRRPKKRTRNRRCQTDFEALGRIDNNNIYQPSANSLPIKIGTSTTRKKKKKKRMKNARDPDTSSLSPANYAETLSGIYEIGSDGKVRRKKHNSSVNSALPTNQSMYSYNSANLGTIYEHEEKNKDRTIKQHSFSSLLESPEMSASFQKLITTKGAIEAFEKSNMSVEDFWQVYFDAKKSSKSVNCTPSISASDSSQRLSITSSLKRVDSCKKRKNKHSSHRKIAEGSGGREKAKIYFTDMLEEAAKCKDFRADSIKSLQVLASKNGPGYVAVLHPICGCPEVSIFIPCYCDEDTGTRVNKEELLDKFEEYLGRNDGRHIVLPRTCRINGQEGGSSRTKK